MGKPVGIDVQLELHVISQWDIQRITTRIIARKLIGAIRSHRIFIIDFD
jgi:hypothetical protein